MPTFSVELKSCNLIALWILLLSTGKNTALNKFVNVLMIEVSYPKNKDELLLKAQNNHIVTLIRKKPTEITTGVRCSTENSVAKQGMDKKTLTDILV